MKDFFATLFEYNHSINQELAAVLINNPEQASEKSIKLLSHILNAHQIWNNRIKPREPLYSVWQMHTVAECRQIDQTNFEHTLHILENTDINSIIHIPKVRGRAFNRSIRDLFFHVINHASYHRGQIATDFRQVGLEPLVSDYFLFEKNNG